MLRTEEQPAEMDAAIEQMRAAVDGDYAGYVPKAERGALQALLDD